MLSRQCSSSHGNVLSDIEDANIYIDDVGASPVIGITMSICEPLFYGNYVKMALPLTHLSVNGPSKKLTG
jgi:hypothetical protein